MLDYSPGWRGGGRSRLGEVARLLLGESVKRIGTEAGLKEKALVQPEHLSLR